MDENTDALAQVDLILVSLIASLLIQISCAGGLRAGCG